MRFMLHLLLVMVQVKQKEQLFISLHYNWVLLEYRYMLMFINAHACEGFAICVSLQFNIFLYIGWFVCVGM